MAEKVSHRLNRVQEPIKPMECMRGGEPALEKNLRPWIHPGVSGHPFATSLKENKLCSAAHNIKNLAL